MPVVVERIFAEEVTRSALHGAPERCPLRTEPELWHTAGMPRRKTMNGKPAFPDRETIAKAEGRFAKADKQRARLKADPQREVAREKQRVKRRKESSGA